MSTEGPHKRILIIEDSIVAGMLMSARIERDDPSFDVRVRKSMKGGIEEFDRFNPELVILDAGLPDSKPDQTLREIPFFKRSAKVMVITGDHLLKREAIEAGADDFMEKVIGEDPSEMFNRISALVKSEDA